MYFTSPKATFNPAEKLSFWEIARSVRQGVVEALTREAGCGDNCQQGMITDELTKPSGRYAARCVC